MLKVSVIFLVYSLTNLAFTFLIMAPSNLSFVGNKSMIGNSQLIFMIFLCRLEVFWMDFSYVFVGDADTVTMLMQVCLGGELLAFCLLRQYWNYILLVRLEGFDFGEINHFHCMSKGEFCSSKDEPGSSFTLWINCHP